jgi:hypothetical protein
MNINTMHFKAMEASKRINISHFGWTIKIGIGKVSHQRDRRQRSPSRHGLPSRREQLQRGKE